MPGLFGIAFYDDPVKRRVLVSKMLRSLMHHNWYTGSVYEGSSFALGSIDIGETSTHFSDGRCELVLFGQYSLHNDRNIGTGNLLDLYYHNGMRFVSDLAGAFSLALWDGQTQEFFVADDRFGLYPVYYSISNERFIYACEVKALITDRTLGWKVSVQAIAEFLSFGHMLEGRTHFENIHLLPPATILRVKNKQLKLTKYWSASAETKPKKLQDFTSELYYALHKSLERIADKLPDCVVPLSGGMDSRTISCILSEISEKPIKTYSFGMNDCWDLVLAKEVAAFLGTRHEEYVLSGEYLREQASNIVYLTDGMLKLCDSAVISSLHKIREIGTLLITGLSGDTIFGSSLSAKVIQFADQPIKLFECIQEYKQGFSEELALETFTGNFQSSMRECTNETISNLIFTYSDAPLFGWEYFNLNTVQRRWIFNVMTLISSQVNFYAPFYDYDVFDIALSLPVEYRVNQLAYIEMFKERFPKLSKIPWQRTGLPLLSSDTYTGPQLKPGKKEFVDINSWMRTELKEVISSLLLNNRFFDRGYCEPKGVYQLVDLHFSGTKNYYREISILLTLEIWHQLFLDIL